MSERRSSRQKRAINYHQLGDNSDGDDDFASSPVQQKKPRLERPERGQKTILTAPPPPAAAAVAQPVLSSDQLNEGCRRLSRDERQFSKDVERALKDSAKENSNSPSEGGQRMVEDQKASADADSPPMTTGQDDSDFHPSEEQEEEEDVLSGPDSSSDIDFDTSPPPKKAKKAAKTEGATKTAAARKRAGAGADRMEAATPVAGKTTCKTVKTSKPTTAARTKSSTQTATPFPSSPPTATVLPKSPLPGHHGTPGLGVRRMPKWTPPAPAGRGNHCSSKATCIGGTPTIRVGLSRNARVKPLHAKCSPHT